MLCAWRVCLSVVVVTESLWVNQGFTGLTLVADGQFYPGFILVLALSLRQSSAGHDACSYLYESTRTQFYPPIPHRPYIFRSGWVVDQKYTDILSFILVSILRIISQSLLFHFWRSSTHPQPKYPFRKILLLHARCYCRWPLSRDTLWI